MIVQNVSGDGRTDISFTLPEDDLDKVEPVLALVGEEVGSPESSAMLTWPRSRS